MDGWLLIRYLHLLALAFFVGGQLMLAAVVVPVERDGDRQRLRAIARRFGWGTLVALAILLGTGIALASHLHLWGDGTLQLKLALVALAGLLIGWHVRSPERRELDAAIFAVSLVIVWLGVSLAH